MDASRLISQISQERKGFLEIHRERSRSEAAAHNFMKLKHILSTHQFLDKKMQASIFRTAEKFEKDDRRGKIPQLLKGKILASVFYEPSTRTRFSFEAAMLKLGGGVITTENARHFSSAIKGETLEDTIRVVSCYADIIVLRHFKEGASHIAAEVSRCPIINAGDGAGEHPTQALLDIYTIKREFGRIEGLNITLLGDLKYGRAIRSLLMVLPIYKNVKIYLVSPKELKLPDAYRKYLKEKGAKFQELREPDPVLGETDVLYTTRVQKERFKSKAEYERLRKSYRIDRDTLIKLKKKAIIMNPLPRVAEIMKEVDKDPRAVYFRQAQNGLYVRMALLALLFEDS